MKAGWQTRTLGEVLVRTENVNPELKPEVEFDYIDVSSVSNKTFQIEGTQLLKGKDAPSRARKLVRTNDILFATIRPTLQRIAIVPEEFNEQICSTGYFVMRPQSSLHHKFLYYYLFGEGFMSRMQTLQKGASYPAVTDAELKSQEINLPPLPEQQRIVTILDQAFEGIATAKANAEKNLTNAREVFESYHNLIFSACPSGWQIKLLGDVCEYVNGKAHEQCIDGDGEFIVINSKFISSNGEIYKRANEAHLMLKAGEIAMVLSDVPNGKALAKCFLVDMDNTYTLNQRICLIRSKHFHPNFLFYQLNRNSHFLQFNNGENQTNLRLNQVLSCPLFIPPIQEQKTIALNLDEILEETQRLEAIYQQKLNALEELKKSILNQAFTGQLN